MKFSQHRGPLLQGLAVFAFFTFVVLALIPVYVPRPAFIPGFAPPPDMWPRTVSIIGAVFGLIMAFGALIGKPAPTEIIDTDGASSKVHALRFLAVLACFAGFLVLVPWIGFLLASAVLIGVAIFLTGERTYGFWAAGITLVGPVLLVSFFHSVLGTQFPVGALTKPFGF